MLLEDARQNGSRRNASVRRSTVSGGNPGQRFWAARAGQGSLDGTALALNPKEAIRVAFGRLSGNPAKGWNFGAPSAGKSAAGGRELGTLAGAQRDSSGIQGFLDHLPDVQGLHILDLGDLSQGTASYLGKQGHHIHYVSLLQSFDAIRDANAGEAGELRPQVANRFIRSHLDYPRNSFHAVLAWDVLQHLDEVTLRVTIAYLSQIMRPNSIMFCMFHWDKEEVANPVLYCSVNSEKTLVLREVGRRKPKWRTSMRKLESLFPQFRAVHFYLKRDALFEVLVFG